MVKRDEWACPTPVWGLRFRTENGRLLPIPCNRSSCPVCSRRQGMITAAMVGIDAAQDQPSVVSTITTRDRVTPATLREGQRQVVRRVRDALGHAARYCSFVEWTTGKYDGRRRPHMHALWKDVHPDEAEVIEDAARDVFGRLAGAYVHEAAALRTPAAAAAYVASHHLKESQAPPPSWRGVRRVRPSRGYWSIPAKELRAMATAQVRERRLEARAVALVQERGLPAEAWEPIFEALDRSPVEVVRVQEDRRGVVAVLGPV